MNEVRVKVYEDQFEQLCVEVNGASMLRNSCPAYPDNVDLTQVVKEILQNLHYAGYLRVTGVTG